MTDYYMLQERIWVTSWTTGPTLYYYADAAKTVTVTLLHEDGTPVTDSNGNTVQTSLSAVQGINSLDLGDWLSAVSITWNEGMYLLEIDNGTQKFYAPFIIATSGQSLPVTETDKIKKIIVQHIPSTVYIELPPTATTIPASSSFRTLIYQHNDDTKLGRLVSIVGTSTEFDTKWIRNAIIQLDIKFSDLNSLAAWLAKFGYISQPNSDTAKAIGDLLNNDPSKVVSILGLYGVLTGINSRILDYQIDATNYVVSIKMLVRLGFGWNDIADALKWALGVGAIVGGVAAGIAVAVGTFGLGTAIGIGIAAAGITFGLKLLFGSSSDTSTGTGSDITALKDNIADVANQGKQHITAQYNNALTDLDNLHSQGQITDTAYNTLKTDIENLYKESITVIDEIVEESKKAIDEAYEKGKKDMYPWVFGAGLGGTILGVIIGKR